MSEKDVDILLEKHGLPTFGDLMEKLVRLRRNHLLPGAQVVEAPLKSLLPTVTPIDLQKKPVRMGRPPKVRD